MKTESRIRPMPQTIRMTIIQEIKMPETLIRPAHQIIRLRNSPEPTIIRAIIKLRLIPQQIQPQRKRNLRSSTRKKTRQMTALQHKMVIQKSRVVEQRLQELMKAQMQTKLPSARMQIQPLKNHKVCRYGELYCQQLQQRLQWQERFYLSGRKRNRIRGHI